MNLRTQGLTWHTAGDDVVILDLEGSMYLKVQGSARVLWERLGDGCEEHDLVGALVDHYGIDRDRAATDVASFLDTLRARGLLVE